MGKTVSIAAIALALAGATANAQAVITERSLSTDAAIDAATAALKRCRQDGYQVVVTVLDQAGRTKAVVSDDRGRLHTVEHSLRKAYTALTYRISTAEYGQRVASTPTAAGTLHLDKITTAAGGLPIRAEFDWRQTGPQSWDIRVETDAGNLVLSGGGSRLVCGERILVDEKPAEYRGVYRRFIELVVHDKSDVDLSPLVHVADAFMLGRRRDVEPLMEG